MRLTGPASGARRATGEARRGACAGRSSSASTSSTPPTRMVPCQEELIAGGAAPLSDGARDRDEGRFRPPGPGTGCPTAGRSICDSRRGRASSGCGERFDLYQLHRIDPQVPLAEQFGALRELQARGQGPPRGPVGGHDRSSRWSGRSLVPIVSVQNRYNVRQRASEDVLDYCDRATASASSRGLRSAGGLAEPPPARPRSPSGWERPRFQVALAWLLRRSPVMLPIPGTGSVAHLEENLGAAAIQLDDATYAEITAAR